MGKTFNIGTKIKKVIEVEDVVVYPIYRKITDALSNEIVAVFKANEYTITKIVCGNNLYPSIQVFENNKDTLSAIYWHGKITAREYNRILKQVKDIL